MRYLRIFAEDYFIDYIRAFAFKEINKQVDERVEDEYE